MLEVEGLTSTPFHAALEKQVGHLGYRARYRDPDTARTAIKNKRNLS